MYNASTNAVVVYDGKESMPCRNDLNAIITCLYLTAIMASGGYSLLSASMWLTIS